MRLIGQKVAALAVLQLYKFSDERLLTGVSLNYRLRPEAAISYRFLTTLNMLKSRNLRFAQTL